MKNMWDGFTIAYKIIYWFKSIFLFFFIFSFLVFFLKPNITFIYKNIIVLIYSSFKSFLKMNQEFRFFLLRVFSIIESVANKTKGGPCRDKQWSLKISNHNIVYKMSLLASESKPNLLSWWHVDETSHHWSHKFVLLWLFFFSCFIISWFV